MRSARGLISTWLVIAATTLTAQQIQGTGQVSGTVFAGDDSSQPVRKAIVTIGGAGANGRSTITDDQGRFVISGLPAGQFTLTAAKPAYLKTAYGAKGPGRPGTALSLAAGQSLANLRLVLPHGAAISGTIRDFNGEPASTMQVLLFRADGTRVVSEGDSSYLPDTFTDERGAYRLYGLMPGTYYVAASPRALGGNNAMAVMSAVQMDALFREQQSRVSNPTGTASGATPIVPTLQTYTPVFYPGTTNSTDAGRITVRAGEDRDGIDFTITLQSVSTVEGRIVNPDGKLPEIDVSLTTDGPQFPALLGGGLSPMTGANRPGVNGNDTFKFPNVTPGHYMLIARSSNTVTTLSPNGAMQSSRQADPGTVPSLWAMTEVDVRNSDVSGITLQLQPAMTISGRVAFDATALPPPQPLTSVRIALASDRSTSPTAFNLFERTGTVISTTVRADGTFTLKGLLPARYRLTATTARGWWLRSAVAGGRDLLDADIDVPAGGSISDAVLTFSDRHTELSGNLQTGSGAPATDYFVVVFPAESSAWLPGGRRLKSTRPATDGRFTFADLPPGNYILSALTDIVDNEWMTPETLQQLSGAGVKLTIGEGEKKTQNLQIGR